MKLPLNSCLAVIVFAVVLVVYVTTLHPSVPGGDSGELIAAAWSGGVAHPPGYPLYTMAARAFMAAVPWGTPAWRANLLSAIFDAAAAALLFVFVAEWTASRAAGLLAAGTFAFSPLIWTWAVAAEVFALNNLIAMALVWVAWRWASTGRDAWAVAGAGLGGLGLSNHHTLVLLGAPLAVWMLWRGRRTLCRPRTFALLVGAGALGLLPYVYLPIAAAGDSPIVWGDWSGAGGLLHHLLRRDYGTLRLGGEIPAGTFFFEQLGSYARSLVTNTLGVGLLLAAVGAACGRAFARVLAGSWLFYVLVFHYAANLPIDSPLHREVTARFWQQPNLLVFALLGMGYAFVERRWLAARFGLAIAIAIVSVQVALHYGSRDESDNTYVADYGRALLEPLPRGATLFTRGDLITNVARYLQVCEGVRPDVTVLDQELATRDWYVARVERLHAEIDFPGRAWDPRRADGFELGPWIEAQLGERELWVYPDFKEGDLSLAGMKLWPVGLSSRVAVASAPPYAWDSWEAQSRHALDELRAFDWPDPTRYPQGTWERVVLEDLWQASNRHAVVLLEHALALGGDRGMLERARALLERVTAEHPAAPWYVYKNLGLAYDRLRTADASLLARRDEAWRRYLTSAPHDEPARAAIAAAVSGSPPP